MPINLPEVTSGYNLSLINNNFQTIESKWDEKLDRLESSQGNQMEQDLDMNSNHILNVTVDLADDGSLVNKGYVDQQDNLRVLKAGDTMTGQLNTIDPVSNSNAANKGYVDGQLSAIQGVEGIIPQTAPRQVGDGVTVEFNSPVSSQRPNNSFDVNIDGVTQRASIDYVCNASGKIVFSEAPPINSDIDISLYEPVNLQEVSDLSQVTAEGSTTPRTLSDRFSETINVKDFGAVGDGVIDDTSSIQAAINVSNTTHKPVLFPTGTYLVTSQLEYEGNGLIGQNREDTIITSTYNGVLFKNNFRNHTNPVKDLYILGPGAGVAGSKAFGQDGTGQGFFRLVMDNVQIDGFETGIELEQSLNCEFTSFYVVRCVIGVYFVGGGSGWNNTWWNNLITFTNCKFDDCSDAAIDFVGTSLSFSGANNIESCGTGIRITRSAGGTTGAITLENLYFEFNTVNDIHIKDVAITLGATLHQAGAGGTTPQNAVLADNSQIYWVGRPVYLDGGGAARGNLQNNTTAVCLFEDFESNRDQVDATSEAIYVTTRLQLTDSRVVQEISNLSTTPIDIIPTFGTSDRQVNHKIEWILEDSSGDWTMFTTYGTKDGGAFGTVSVSGAATYVSNSEFTVSFSGYTYTFKTSLSQGSMTIESNAATGGTTKLFMRVVNSRIEDLLE